MHRFRFALAIKRGIDHCQEEIDLMLSGNQFTHETVSVLLPQSSKACAGLSGVVCLGSILQD